MSLCPRCGAKCADNAVFCGECGARVDAVSTSPNVRESYSFVAGSVDTLKPIEAPGFGATILTCFSKYCSARGRASRTEFWYWVLFLLFSFLSFVTFLEQFRLLAGLFFDVCETSYSNPYVVKFGNFIRVFYETRYLWNCLWILGVIFPTFAVFVRRFHDTSVSSQTFLISLCMLVAGVVLTIVAFVGGMWSTCWYAIILGAFGLISPLFQDGIHGPNRFGPAFQKRNRKGSNIDRRTDEADSSQQNTSEKTKHSEFWNAVVTCFMKYFSFKGRASRSEFWNWICFLSVINITWYVLLNLSWITGLFEGALATLRQPYRIWTLAILLPTLSVYVRRLHDVGKTGKIMAILVGLGIVMVGTMFLDSGGYQFWSTSRICQTLAILTFFGFKIWLWAICGRRGTEGENRFGLEPQKRN